jgi:hypothetical protein
MLDEVQAIEALIAAHPEEFERLIASIEARCVAGTKDQERMRAIGQDQL